jgi:hypothetical protein
MFSVDTRPDRQVKTWASDCQAGKAAQEGVMGASIPREECTDGEGQRCRLVGTTGRAGESVKWSVNCC